MDGWTDLLTVVLIINFCYFYLFISARNLTCCEKIIKCLSHVPFASLIAWIILVIGLGAITGNLLVGAHRSRDLLKSSSQ